MDPAVEQGHLTLAAEFQRKHRAGLMTLLFTDMVGSTRLKMDLGDVDATKILEQHHTLVRTILARHAQAEEIKIAGDSFLIVFRNPSDAVSFALQLQAALGDFSRRVGRPIEDRVGIHVGEVLVEDTGQDGHPKDLSGIQVDTCARVMALCGPGHILLTRFAFENARQMLKGQTIEGVGLLHWVIHGFFQLKGVDEPIEICEVAEQGRTVIVPLADSEKAKSTAEQDAAFGLAMIEEATAAKSPLAKLRGAVRKNAHYGAVGAVLVGVLTLVALALPLGSSLSNLSYDTAFWFRPVIVPEGVVLVYMDDSSHIELNQPWFQSWDRAVHARLVDRLARSQAKAIVFDILFEESRNLTNRPSGDSQLIEAAKENGSVFVAATIGPQVHGGVLLGSKLTPPFLGLRAVTKWGLVEKVEADYAVRRHYKPPAEQGTLTLAECVAVHTLGKPLPVVRGARWINFYGPPGTLPYYSYHQALRDGAVPDLAFSNKVVFVGAQYGVGFTGGKGTDDFVTPYTRLTGRKSPGAEVIATTYLNLIRRDWLRRMTPLGELGTLVFLGGLAGFGMVLCRPVWAAGIGLGCALLLGVAAGLMVWRTHYWFSWAVVSLVQIPAAVSWSVLTQTLRLQKEKKRLEKAVAARRSAARVPASDSKPAGLVADGVQGGRGSLPRIPDHELINRIGQGAYGEVWLAADVTGCYHAVKVVYLKSFKDRRPFDREFRGVQHFTPVSRLHPGLIHVLHVGRNDHDGYFYYIMEIADDETTGSDIDPAHYSPKNLAKMLARSGALPVGDCLKLGVNLSAALHFLHENGLTHRDIKPANIPFARGNPKLADIGLVEELADTGGPITAVGTVGYLAPEGPGRPAADIFSLGKVLYEAGFGKKVDAFPELPTDIAQHPDGPLLLELNEVILKACQPNPAHRYQSAGDLHADLVRLQTKQLGRQSL